MENTIALYSLKAREGKTYAFASLFIAGNLILPQLCHLLPVGGPVLLPIYFFTLIAAYKYGYLTGLLTALASPIINHALFGMPATEMLPIILTKSLLLTAAASYIAYRTKEVSLKSLLIVIVAYQSIGTLAEWGLTGSLYTALQDIRMGIPGLLLQLTGGYYCLRYIK